MDFFVAFLDICNRIALVCYQYIAEDLFMPGFFKPQAYICYFV